MSKFETTIDATGPAGNIFSILGTAQRLMKQLQIEQTEIDKLGDSVMASKNYDEAVGHVEEWFPVEREDF